MSTVEIRRPNAGWRAGRARWWRAGRAWWWRHPEIPLATLAAIAWIALTVDHFAGHGAEEVSGWHFSIGWWTVMVVAMMVPGTLPMQRSLSFDSLWRRRHRNPAIFTATYVGVWIAFAIAGLVVVWILELTGVEFAPSPPVTAAVLVAAAFWQASAPKQRALRRCHLTRPVAPSGWRANRDLVRFGIFHGRACVVSCGPIMAAMFVSAHDLHLMAPLAAVTVVERYQRRPDPQLGVIVLSGMAVLTLLSGS